MAAARRIFGLPANWQVPVNTAMPRARANLLILLSALLLWPAASGSAQTIEAPAPAATDPTSARIIALHLAARGGEAAIAAAGILESTGRLREGIEEHRIVYWHSPDGRARLERRRTAMGWDYEQIAGHDRGVLWQQELLPHRRAPLSVELDEAGARLLLECVLPFLFLESALAQPAYSYRGQREFAGRKAYVLQCLFAGVLPLGIFFDSESFLILNYRYPIEVAGQRVIVDRMPLGVRRSGGVLWETGHDFRVGRSSAGRLDIQYHRTSAPLDPAQLDAPPIHERWLRQR